MTIKEQVLAMVKDLPDDVGFERIEYHLYVLKKIGQGKAALDRGECLSKEEAERRLARWLKP